LKKARDKIKFGGKIIGGFLLAIFFVIGISLITFFSIRNLLSTVENLTEPNERLQQLNGLLADVYLLDMSRGERTSEVDAALEGALNRIDERLLWLKEHASLVQDVESYEKIHHNVRELLIGYAGLEEVRLNLNQRNFTQEALQSIEKKIQRKQESSELESLGRLASRDFYSLTRPTLEAVPNLPRGAGSYRQSFDSSRNQKILRDLRRLNFFENDRLMRNDQGDSMLIALRAIVQEIFVDEQVLKSNFTKLEAELLTKNKEIFSDIQQLVSGMQRDLLLSYLQKNESAYDLSYSVSVILVLMVIFVIIASLGFVWNILKEIKGAHIYQTQLEKAKMQSEKLAKAKQNFLANMSHEIRNPLHAIQGYQMALSQTDLSHEQRDFLEMIGFASNTLIGIVNDILDFSKLEAGKITIEKRPFDPQELFGSFKKFFSLKAKEKNLFLEWEIDFPQNYWLAGDALRITQIINNLMSNSLKFTESGGIMVKTVYSESDSNLKMIIEDTGLGMSEEVLAVVFQEFNQGDTTITRKFGGTGLGLSIVKKLVDLQGGKIQVSSVEGKGTTLSIQLPTELTTPEEISTNENLVFSLAGKRVLLVDDDKIGLRFLKILLEKHQAFVKTYVGGTDFRENFRRENFDIAILDLQMPEVSGEQVLEELRGNNFYSSLRVLAMTANVFVEEQIKLLDKGFDGLILKPFNEEQVLGKLREILIAKERVAEESIEVFNDISKKSDYDLSDIYKFCMNDEQLAEEVMNDWINTTRADKERLNLAMEQKDFLQIQSIVHQLSSRLAQIKAVSAGLASEIENQLKKGITEGVNKKVLELISHLDSLLNKLTQEYSGFDLKH
jgi:signal transduction histidine kinase/DNA-binding response OmpR family regulator